MTAQRMQFSWTVNLGQVLQFAGIIIGGAGLYFGMDARIGQLELDSRRHEEAIKLADDRLTSVQTTSHQALKEYGIQITTRMDRLSSDMSALAITAARTDANMEGLRREVDRARGGR